MTTIKPHFPTFIGLNKTRVASSSSPQSPPSEILQRSKSLERFPSVNNMHDHDVKLKRSESQPNLKGATLAYGSRERFDKFSHLINTDELDVTQEQRDIFHELKGDKNFRHFISCKDWNEIPDYMNQLILVKHQIQDKNPEYNFPNMHGFLAKQRQTETENHIHAESIRNALKGENNDWAVKLKKAEVNPEILKKIVREIEAFTPKTQDRDAFLLTVVNNLLTVKSEMKTKKIGNVTVQEYFDKLPKNWHGSSPWYNVYGDKFKRANGETGFKVLADVLPHIKSLGCKNVYILPHFESSGGDGGYDPSRHFPDRNLGGEEGFNELLAGISKHNMTLTTDLVIGHVSPEHEWFQKAVNGDPKYYNYFVKSPKHWPRDYSEEKNVVMDDNDEYKLVFEDRGKDGEKVKTKLNIIFPDFAKTTWLNTAVKGLKEKVPMHHTFYTFQMDLNAYNPHILDEMLKINSRDMLSGVAGTRVDAPALVIKNIGGGNVEPQAKNFYDIISLFRKACHENVKTIPEFPGFDHEDATLEAHQSAAMKVAGVIGDYPAFFKAFGHDIDMRKKRGNDVHTIVPTESHDDVEVHHLGEAAKKKYLEIAKNNPRMIIYKADRVTAGRVQDQLGGKSENMMNHNTIINFMPGVPCYFYGGELGVHNDFERLKTRQIEQHEITNRLLKPAGLSKSLEDCLDPRELQRAEIPFSEIEKKKDSPSVKILQELSETRSQHPVMNSRHCRQVQISSPDPEAGRIFSIAKLPEGKEHQNILVNLTNTAPETKRVKVNLKDSLPELQGSDYKPTVVKVLTPKGDKLDVKKSHPIVHKDGDLQLQLAPYQAIILSLDADGFHAKSPSTSS